VDAGDGGPVTLRSVITGCLVSELIDAAVAAGIRPATEKRNARLDALRPELAEIRRRYGTDGMAALRSGLRLFVKAKVSPVPPKTLASAAQMALTITCIRVLPRRQSLSDLIAGIVTITEKTQN
jgi:membrane protein insertase Oxa1/YidC/SpoIIIJ